jgi:hypothetical protein
MVTSRDQTAGRSHNMKTDNSSNETVEEFKYLGVTLTDQNSIQEEIKNRLKLGNACTFFPYISPSLHMWIFSYVLLLHLLEFLPSQIVCLQSYTDYYVPISPNHLHRLAPR